MYNVTPQQIRHALSYRPASGPLPLSRSHSAVALVLRDSSKGVEILYIIRSAHDHDPWSGNIAFPGGRVDPSDANHRATAQREAWEELGLQLEEADYLGELEPIAGTNLPVTVSCFVYWLDSDTLLHCNDEVQRAFWYPISMLLEPQRHQMTEVHFQEMSFTRPALHILPAGQAVLWGITYRLTAQILERLGTPLSFLPGSDD